MAHFNSASTIPPSSWKKEYGIASDTGNDLLRGKQLFRNISEFYAWYSSWDRNAAKHSQIYEYISRLMRIAKTSFEGGHYLESEEDHSMQLSLNQLRENLYLSKVKQNDLSKHLLEIIQSLIKNNPKAKLIDTTTQIEYYYLIDSFQHLSDDLIQEIKSVTTYIITKTDPALPIPLAILIEKNIAKLLENRVLTEELPDHLWECCKELL